MGRRRPDGQSGLVGLRHGIRHLLPHSHDHVGSSALDSGAVGIRATKISLIGLGITAAFQMLIVVFSGSVALLSDTIHNLADALTAIPLWVAFALGRRRPTQSFTYGLNRLEDIAGLFIVVAIAASAVMVMVESLRRFAEPRLIDFIPWVLAAGLVGALGNEYVARYRIRVGTAIGSEALITDGHHARTDAMTSLAVVVAAVGAALGAAWVDPAAGLVVAAAIFWVLVRSARRMVRRLLDGVDPELVDEVADAAAAVAGVEDITDLRVRWHGHLLRIAVSVGVDPGLTVKQGHDIAIEVEHALHHRFSYPVTALVHVDPHDDSDGHEATAHHRR